MKNDLLKIKQDKKITQKAELNAVFLLQSIKPQELLVLLFHDNFELLFVGCWLSC